MTSRVRIRSSRANGALSRGPTTPEGKLRSTGNRCTHGLYSSRIVLKNESQEEYDAFLQKYIDSMHPQDSLELIATRQMAAASWCIRRLQATETSMLNNAMNSLDPAIQDPMDRIAQAFSLLIQDSAFLLIPRLESRYSRQFYNARESIFASRKRARTPIPASLEAEILPRTKNESSIPLNETLTSKPPEPPIMKNEVSIPLDETFINPPVARPTTVSPHPLLGIHRDHPHRPCRRNPRPPTEKLTAAAQRPRGRPPSCYSGSVTISPPCPT